MVSFKYDLNQDSIELQASNWSGLERVFVNGQMVSSKLNFGQNSIHSVKLKDGNPCRFQLLIDPQTDELTCRIYKRNQLIASLKQGKENLLSSQRFLQHGLLFGSVALLIVMLLNP